jgi:hypothetical protein
MPDNQALQVCYGTLPLIAVLVAIWCREQMFLRDILARLRHVEELAMRLLLVTREAEQSSEATQ